MTGLLTSVRQSREATEAHRWLNDAYFHLVGDNGWPITGWDQALRSITSAQRQVNLAELDRVPGLRGSYVSV